MSGGNLLVVYSTSNGQVADDGKGANSLYALAQAQHLRDTTKPVVKQFDLVRASTRQATDNRQNPTREGDLEVDVMLVDRHSVLAAAALTVPQAAATLPAATPSPAPPESNAGSAEAMVIRIGHVGLTSGAIAHLGRDNENGALMAVEELNARGVSVGGRRARFELVTADGGRARECGGRAPEFRDFDSGLSHLRRGRSSANIAVGNQPEVHAARLSDRFPPVA